MSIDNGNDQFIKIVFLNIGLSLLFAYTYYHQMDCILNKTDARVWFSIMLILWVGAPIILNVTYFKLSKFIPTINQQIVNFFIFLITNLASHYYICFHIIQTNSDLYLNAVYEISVYVFVLVTIFYLL